MTAMINTFHNTRPCPKCGGKDMGNQYHEANSCRHGRNECSGVYNVEHIKRHCRRCAFEWAELCVSASAEPTSENVKAALEIGRSYHDHDLLSDSEIKTICERINEAVSTTNGDTGKVELSARQVCLLLVVYYAKR